jgi:predicted HTH transcriptional regulator
MLSSNYRAKGLNLNVIRHINHKEALFNLLEQIRIILQEFRIYAGNPKISRQYKKEDGIHIVMYVNITDYRSLINFYKIIGLAKGEKFEKLKKIVKRKIFYSKGNERILNNKILEFLSKKELASTAEIANYTKKSKSKTIKKLKQLHNKNLVKIIGKVASNRSYLWELEGGENKVEQA